MRNIRNPIALAASAIIFILSTATSSRGETAEKVFGIPFGADVRELQASFAGYQSPIDSCYVLSDVPLPLPSYWIYSVAATPKSQRIHSIAALFPHPGQIIPQLTVEIADAYVAGIMQGFRLGPSDAFLPGVERAIVESIRENPAWTELLGRNATRAWSDLPDVSNIRDLVSILDENKISYHTFKSSQRLLLVVATDQCVQVFATDALLRKQAVREVYEIANANSGSDNPVSTANGSVSRNPRASRTWTYEEYQQHAAEARARLGNQTTSPAKPTIVPNWTQQPGFNSTRMPFFLPEVYSSMTPEQFNAVAGLQFLQPTPEEEEAVRNSEEKLREDEKKLSELYRQRIEGNAPKYAPTYRFDSNGRAVTDSPSAALATGTDLVSPSVLREGVKAGVWK